MSNITKDFLRPATLSLMLDYFGARDQIRSARRRGKKICSIILAMATELVEAAGCVPISLYRLGSFLADNELRLMRTSKSIFGGRSLVRSLSLLNAAIGSNFFNRFADREILDSLWKNYHKYIDSAKNHDYPLDACFGTRIYYGALQDNKELIDFSIGYGTRCGWFTKFFQDCAAVKPATLLDMPIEFNEAALDYQISEVQRVIKVFEEFTNRSYSVSALQEEIRRHNSIRNSYWEILKIWAQEKTALSPPAFINVLSMLHFGYTDHLSKGSRYFDQSLQSLLREFKRNLTTDLSESPKLLLAPMFGGFEPDIMKITSNFGCRLLYADYFALGVLDPIEETVDPIYNYSKHLMNISQHWHDNVSIIDNWIKLIKDLKLDGVIFNAVYGCKSFTPAFKLFKDRLLELEVPIIELSFHNMGENLGQLETRIGAFVEMIKA